MDKKDRQINSLQANIRELYVVIDTLQACLRSAYDHVPEKEKPEVSTPSFRWCMNWKHGDEK